MYRGYMNLLKSRRLVCIDLRRRDKRKQMGLNDRNVYVIQITGQKPFLYKMKYKSSYTRTRPNLRWLQGSVSLITRRLGQDTAPCLKMMLDKAEISKVPSQKRLVVTLYRNMAYDSHVDDLCKKLSKQIKSVSLSVQAPIYKENKERRQKNAIDHALFHKAVVN